MCIICVGLEMDKLTAFEADRNLGEMRTQLQKEGHLEEVVKKIEKKKAEKKGKYVAPGIYTSSWNPVTP